MTHNIREANRAAAARTAAEQRALASEAERGRAEKQTQIAYLALQAELLVPKVLESLAARGYEGIRQVTRDRRTLFGGYKPRNIGAYPLCTLTVRTHGELVARDTMLGSDGSIWPWSESLAEFIKMVRQHESVDGASLPVALDQDLFSISGLAKIVDALAALAN